MLNFDTSAKKEVLFLMLDEFIVYLHFYHCISIVLSFNQFHSCSFFVLYVVINSITFSSRFTNLLLKRQPWVEGLQ